VLAVWGLKIRIKKRMADKKLQKSPGAQANQDFIDRIWAEETQLQEQVPDACLGCSTAWLYAHHGRGEARLAACPGRSEVAIGELSVMACHLPPAQEI
jgi:hypothetical protein